MTIDMTNQLNLHSFSHSIHIGTLHIGIGSQLFFNVMFSSQIDTSALHHTAMLMFSNTN